MFVDKVKVFVKGGDGGNGMVAYRREKYVPDGGPAGGDGGRGASVVFEVEEGLRTLMDFRYNRHFKAPRGEHGRSKSQHGKNAPDMVVKVPPGTTVVDEQTGQVIADLTEHGQKATIAKGGRGGRGNTRFATPANPAPEIAENGEPGVEREVVLELKVLADVGLVGFPSVGKSTLLSVVSAAKPKIAEYHFTTITPNLGVVETEDSRSFVMADLPGLIEGAHQGVGLGHQFLRHIERTRVIVHVIDMSGLEGRDPYEDYLKINDELKQYNMRLLERPQLVVANKMDMPDAKENLEIFRAKLTDDVPIFPISAFTKQGVRELLLAVADKIEQTPEFPLHEETEEARVVYKHEKKEVSFIVSRGDDGAYELSGAELERLFKMTDFTHDESIKRFARQLRGMGVDQALRDRGAKDGDLVRIMKFEFEFIE
ncbi:GTPase CgtA [Alkalihalobacillus alcalophilus ATCC 27647 = CGMCC 1.3604]|uniref:GTPase Obg n=1 Tax=Alkalihalobacillus alcalophilus ATCC 27647 = CGMCC 1.3604 TaxID=1218173 RepID=A0A094YX28_ALKAL|nr:GTPase ObgE [Alkalihalobacillus alcalophilus]KGA98082.1 GTPase ObgE [Alkalihalobacillus alcalophilus ATCC 27647 = CGMCC 1.3604]MED1561029.1 GTPase ObgE [Alkalihalobacillus alcalophilus]THG88348.1 GTPase CgtA [Alkalihalobacillus alcalophilus ATCC 27647 = CGMCC 1.3604]